MNTINVNNSVILLIDDVHLETRPFEMINSFIVVMQEKIEEIKKLNKHPILVATGDISEGIKGIEWLKNFECDIIYVTGNHEYYHTDIDDLDKEIELYIKAHRLNNIHFLNNKSVVINEIKFIGCTLWTSLGSFLPWNKRNEIIKYFTSMSDFKNIYALDWYTEDNTRKLIKFLKSSDVSEEKINFLIENKFFNPLIEIEKHKESVKYIIDELNNDYDGLKIVTTHHMPIYESWLRTFNLDSKYLKGEWVNNREYIYNSAKGKNPPNSDILMMSFYVNDLKDLMYGSLAPDYWLHGHLHIPTEEIIGKTKIISNPIGYFRQNKELKIKEIYMNQSYEFTKMHVLREIESFSWGGELLNNIKYFEKTINNYEEMSVKFQIDNNDFENIFKNYIQIHDKNLKNLESQLLKWLSLLYYSNYQDENKNLDLYNIQKRIGYPFDKLRFPEYLNLNINKYSFISEEVYKNNYKGDNKNAHCKEWIKEIQKIQIQIIQFKKFLIEFIRMS